MSENRTVASKSKRRTGYMVRPGGYATRPHTGAIVASATIAMPVALASDLAALAAPITSG